MMRVCLLVALVSFPAAAFAQGDPSLCEGELEAIRRDHTRLRVQHDALEANLEGRPTKKVHDKLVSAHNALRDRFKNAPKKSAYARLERNLEKAKAEIAKLKSRPTGRDVAKWRKRAETAEAELENRPAAKAHARLQAQLDAARKKLSDANGTVEGTEGYGKVRWGMKPRTVKRKYNSVKDAGDYLYHHTKIAGRDAVVNFSFARKQLARVAIQLKMNDDDAVVEFNRIGKLLTKKYGAPKKRDKQWNNKRHKKDKTKWNQAVRNGDLVLTATWETDETLVILTSRGSDGEAQAVIRYNSKELAPLVEAETERKQLRGL